MARKIIVEVNPYLDYLGEVLRELRWKKQEIGCKDQFLLRIFEQRKYKYVSGSHSFWFKFDLIHGKHHRGQNYVFDVKSSTLKKVKPFGQRRINMETGERESYLLIAEINVPDLKEVTSDDLLNSLRELDVLEIMNL